ncbi:DUF4249 family protein [Ekhidna sp.]|uniref:DUF4249 family protein n=1 Tax=Ekhidna sp. TaxID=2608089 RepID=UPI003CCC147E
MKKLLIILMVLLSWQCEEISEQELGIDNDVLLVVDGGITNELGTQEIKLSLTFNELGQEPPPVTDALVIVNEGEDNYFFTHDESRPGTYTNNSLVALFGKVYILYIQYDGKEFYAFATSGLGTSLPPLTLEETNTGDMEYIHTETIASMTNVRVEWDDDGIVESKEGFFYTLDVVDITKTFAPEKEPFTFPRGATVHRKKYSLTPDHQNFLRSFLAEVDWRGGGFDAAPGNVLTNLSDGALGYFYVSMVDSDSTVVN